MDATYLTLSDVLAAELAKARPGDPVPSEHDLAARHKVSRLTARAALQELEHRYLVRRIQGRGTFVTRRIEYRVTPDIAPSWTQTVRSAGADPATVNDSVRTRRAHRRERDGLGLSPQAKVTVVRRRRYIDDELVGMATSVVPTDVVPGLADRLGPTGSLYEALVECDLQPERDLVRVKVEAAPGEIASSLGLRGRPHLVHQEGALRCAHRGRRIEINESWLRADVFDLVVEIGRYG